MTREELIGQIKAKKSFLCVGLDTDINKVPHHLLPEKIEKEDDFIKLAQGVFEFNKQIIDATAPFTVAYKPNIAFYEAMGLFGIGFEVLQQTIAYLNQKYPDIFTILDAKRGDIGNTTDMYANAYFAAPQLSYDAVTIAPYMGKDSVAPFLRFPGKWAVVLALTSNPSAADFETEEMKNGHKLYQTVLEKSKMWGSLDNMMYVVGATRADDLSIVRMIVPEHFLLVPGVGAQGGSLQDVAKYGMVKNSCGLLVNSSRGIIYASSGDDFASKAGEEAQKMQQQMEKLLDTYL